MKDPKAGDNIRKMAADRQNAAMEKFIKAGGLAFTPLLISALLRLPAGLSVLICIGFWVYAAKFFLEGQKLLIKANLATQGAEGEEKVSQILEPLKNQGWVIEYNIPLKNWGDADAFLASPQGNYFVIDTKTNKGSLFFNGSVLKLRYGQNIYDFRDKKDVLKAVRGQAASLKDMKELKFVQPILCFTQANLEEINQKEKINGVYVVSAQNLVEFLQQLNSSK
jgi:hypothetical protein